MLSFLGRGAAFNVREGNTSAFIKKDGRLFLIDCGETVYEKLVTKGVLEGVNEVYAVITHLHGDHCGSLGTLSLYCNFAMNHPLTLILPEDGAYRAQIKQLLLINGAGEGVYRIISENEMPEVCGVKSVKYALTRHAPGMTCHSLHLETEEGFVFYSGDTADTGTLLDFIKEHPDFARLYVDVGEKEGGVHLPIGQLSDALTEEQKRKTLIMHLGSANCITLGRDMGLNAVECV